MNILLLQPEDIAQDGCVLITEAARVAHITHTLKLRVGDTLKVGVLHQHLGVATVADMNAGHIVLNGLSTLNPPPAKIPLTLVVCLPRPKALRRLVADASAQGVAHLVLLHSYKVEKSYWQTPYLNQLNAFVRLGLEQAGDTVPPIISLEKRFKPFVEDRLPQLLRGKTALLAHPYATAAMPVGLNHPSLVVVGAEGGFIPYELDMLMAQGCQAVSLGARILRTETAINQLVGRLFTAN